MRNTLIALSFLPSVAFAAQLTPENAEFPNHP
jgi:hypothetical protein